MKEKETKKRPVLQPYGWQARNRYIDSNGEVYKKGTFTGEIVPENEIPTTVTPDETTPTPDTTEVQEKTKTEIPKEKLKDIAPEAMIDLLEDMNDKFNQQQEQMVQQQALINKLLLSKGEKAVSFDTMDNKLGYNSTKDISAEDYQEKKETFMIQGRGTLLSMYEINGQYYYPPYKMPPAFKYYYTDLNRKGKATEIFFFSTYSTNSKSEIEFIKNSPQYKLGIITNTIEDMVKHTSESYDKIQNVTLYVSRLSTDKLYNLATGYHIDVRGKTIDDVKHMVISRRIAELQVDEAKRQETTVARLAEDAIFNTKKDQ